MSRGTLAATLVLSLLVNAFSLPAHKLRRDLAGQSNLGGSLQVKESNDLDPVQIQTSSPTLATPDPFDDDDDDFDEPMNTSSSGGGSSIFSLLNIVSALFPGSSGSNILFRNMLNDLIFRNGLRIPLNIRREATKDNIIDIDYSTDMKSSPHLERQESESSDSEEISNESSESEDISKVSSENESESQSASVENNAAEESVEVDNGDSKKDSDSNDSDDYDSDEPPGGDGQGGGILGLLAGLSGGEDGESDLGTLLAAISGIVANLSGDGIDLNSLIGSGVGLFAGLLSGGEENPGAVVASYLLTSLDTITGGGANNNGAFFGNFLSKLVKGTSAGGDPDASSEEGDEDKPTMADSAGFFISLLMSLLGDMSKGSSGGSSPWRRQQIMRPFLKQFS